MTNRLSSTRRPILAGAACATGVLASAAPSRAEPGVLRVASPWEWTSSEPSDTGYLMSRLQIAET
ncbi:MAG: hypothetical protein ACK51F_07965, partial [Rhodospirillales bacterium]